MNNETVTGAQRAREAQAPIHLPAGALVARPPHLHRFRRGARVLFVERESGSWQVLEGERLRLYMRADRPVTVRTFVGFESTLSCREKEQFLWDLYTHGLVEIGGKSCFEPSRLWQPPRVYPTFLCLHMTEKCNLACRYCQADATLARSRMPLSTATRIVDRLCTEMPVEAFTLDFHGGEPFLEYANMMRVVAHAKELGERLGKKPSFMVQTNGTALTPERVRELLREGVHVGISLDGPASVHDAQRVTARGKGSFERVWGNARRALDMGLKTGFLAVIHDPRDYRVTSRWFLEQGFRSFRLNYSSAIGRAPRDLEFPAGREEAFARHWIEMVADLLEWSRTHGEHLNVADVTNQINNLTTKSRPFMCYRSPCGAGNSALGFGTDGGIFACEEMASLDYFRVGNILDGSVHLKEMVDSNPTLRALQQRTVDNIPRCSGCHLKRICSGGCTSKVFAKYGTMMRESPMCGYYQRVYEDLMWMIHDNPDMVENLGYAGLSSPRFASKDRPGPASPSSD